MNDALPILSQFFPEVSSSELIIIKQRPLPLNTSSTPNTPRFSDGSELAHTFSRCISSPLVSRNMSCHEGSSQYISCSSNFQSRPRTLSLSAFTTFNSIRFNQATGLKARTLSTPGNLLPSSPSFSVDRLRPSSSLPCDRFVGTFNEIPLVCEAPKCQIQNPPSVHTCSFSPGISIQSELASPSSMSQSSIDQHLENASSNNNDNQSIPITDAEPSHYKTQLFSSQSQAGSSPREKGLRCSSAIGANTLPSEMENLLSNYEKSEKLLLDAQSRIEELEILLSRTSPLSKTVANRVELESETIAHLNEMNKALTNSREKAENLRYSLRQEEQRSAQLASKLHDMEEALFGEQERTASLLESIKILNLEVDANKTLLEEANQLREREAERSDIELTSKEVNLKLNEITAAKASLEESLKKLQGVESENADLRIRLREVEAAYSDYSHIKEELKQCKVRETQLSEFTRRLTERNAGLQSDYLSAQSRLEATEKAVSEARNAAQVAGQLVQTTVEKFNSERESLRETISSLQKKLDDAESAKMTLKSQLAAESNECSALRRSKVTLDRELARLHSHSNRLLMRDISTDFALVNTNGGVLTNVDPNVQSASESDVHNNPSSPEPTVAELQCYSLETSSFCTEISSKMMNRDEDLQNLNPVEMDKSDLISRLERYQKLNVRLLDKLDFLRDHTNHLTVELQRKAALLQHYFLAGKESNGGTSSILDANKLAMIQKGGLMASIFAGRDIDEQANLKVCLEINQKMQLVLEDALFKNISLKENVEALTSEISTLKSANAELGELPLRNNISL